VIDDRSFGAAVWCVRVSSRLAESIRADTRNANEVSERLFSPLLAAAIDIERVRSSSDSVRSAR